MTTPVITSPLNRLKIRTVEVMISILLLASLATFVTLGFQAQNIKFPLIGAILLGLAAIGIGISRARNAARLGTIQHALARLADGDSAVKMPEATGEAKLDGMLKSIVDIKNVTEENTRFRADVAGQIEAISKAQAVIEFNMDGTIIMANDHFLNALGYRLDEIQGQHHSMFLEPGFEQSAEYRAFWDRLNRGLYEAQEYKRIGKGGKEVWIQASYNPIIDPDGKPFKVVKYATDITEQKLQSTTNMRIKIALDNAGANVMVADTDFNIVYMNDILQKMLHEAEPEIRKALPNFNAGKLIGTNIDIFHKNPAHQRGMMQNLTSTIETNIKVGKFDFNLLVNPVTNTDGERLGTVVEWKDMTQELAIEAEINEVVNAAASGDFTRRLSTEGKEDFMLSLADNMNAIGSNTQAATDDLARVLAELAQGNLTEKIDADYEGTFELLKNSANGTAKQLTSIVSQVNSSAGEVASAASELSTGSDDLSRRTEAQASALEETAASMEELAVTVKKNADNAGDANKLADKSREMAVNGGEVAKQAVEAMGVIEESSQKVSDIIGVIDDLAFQTNLLALNAAVEAARAGEAGKGFAVVAEEVRTLAQRSAQASNEIKSLITSSNTQVKSGVELVNNAGTALDEIMGSISKVAEIVSEIASASSEQTQGIDEVNVAIAEMDDMTQQNSSLVEESTAAARVLERQAAEMQRLMSFFKIEQGGGQLVASPVLVQQEQAARVVTPVKQPDQKKTAAGANSEWAEF